jgi:thymidylate kinase
MERSPYFQALVFVAANHALGRFTNREFELLQNLYKHVLGIWSPALYIYLRSNPQRCCERIRRRNRDAEDRIEPAYIALLHQKHEDAYYTAVRSGLRVVVVDVEDKNPDQIADEVIRAVFGVAGLAGASPGL